MNNRAKSMFLALRRCVTFAALLGLVAEPCFSQNKPVSQLLSPATLESITGYKFDAPKELQAKDNGEVLPFDALPALISSSGCSFPISPSKPGEIAGAKGGVTIMSWLFGRTDAESAKEETKAVLANRFVGREDDPTLAYPAVFADASGGLYVFKSTPAGLWVLLIESGVPGYGGSLSTVLDLDNKIALAVLGGAEKPAGVVPLDLILDKEDSLKGLTGVSVLVYVNGQTEGTANDLRVEVVRQIEQLGITVFPENTPPKFPILYVNVNLRDYTYATKNLLGGTTASLAVTTYAIALYLDELFPVRTGDGQKYVQGKTWSTESFDTEQSAGLDLSDLVGRRMAKFLDAYQKANRDHPTAYQAGVAGAGSAATGSAAEALPAKTVAVRQTPQLKAFELPGLVLAMQPIAPGTFEMGSRPGASSYRESVTGLY